LITASISIRVEKVQLTKVFVKGIYGLYIVLLFKNYLFKFNFLEYLTIRRRFGKDHKLNYCSCCCSIHVSSYWHFRVLGDEIAKFKNAIQRFRREIIGDDGTITWEFYSGVSRVQKMSYSLTLVAFVIRKIIGTNASTTSCERTFNYVGIVLNSRRTSLATDTADKI